jgi:hypothetical protein
MDVGNIAALSTDLAQTRQNQAVGIALLKKTLEIQGTTAASLIDAISQVPSVPLNLPDHLGKNIDTTA